MELEIINVTVTSEAKQVLLDYQREHNIRHQGNALDKLLIDLKDVMIDGKR